MTAVALGVMIISPFSDTDSPLVVAPVVVATDAEFSAALAAASEHTGLALRPVDATSLGLVPRTVARIPEGGDASGDDDPLARVLVGYFEGHASSDDVPSDYAGLRLSIVYGAAASEPADVVLPYGSNQASVTRRLDVAGPFDAADIVAEFEVLEYGDPFHPSAVIVVAVDAGGWWARLSLWHTEEGERPPGDETLMPLIAQLTR